MSNAPPIEQSTGLAVFFDLKARTGSAAPSPAFYLLGTNKFGGAEDA